MTTHAYGTRWIDCMRGADGCKSDAEHDLRDEVVDLREEKEGLREDAAAMWKENARLRAALDEALRLMDVYCGVDHCARIRAIAEGR